MNVGLCWVGSKSHKNDGIRSLPPEAVRPLAAVEGVKWICLAKDAWTDAMGAAGLVNGLAYTTDWYDTARVIERLDLVISVDTAIAHVAGGLGKPVWILIAAVPDMRWMLDRSDTPWYRSAKLYRQQVAGVWAPVVEQVAVDLTREVQIKRTG